MVSGRADIHARAIPLLRSLGRLLTRSQDQLDLAFEAAPRNATELLARLRSLGLVGIDRCRLTRNRAVMVSYRGRELRVHQGYLAAPVEVLTAVVTFVSGKTAASRRLARKRILAYPIARAPRARRPDAPHPDDAPLAKRLTEWHRRYNDRHFDGALKTIAVRVSRRMRARLGHYMSASPSGEAAEIVVSRRHIRRHGWEEGLHTLLHEMVHQWQDETGHPIDHGPLFRAKAREVGVVPSARRTVTPVRSRKDTAPAKNAPAAAQHLSLKAAREE
ncbi:MAG TPA: SprT-like domain-containing protein [Gemmatimonadaceae bacterium]|nr:SprT-like domain-containing protein [Gemmatimonadaceae bacterium]